MLEGYITPLLMSYIDRYVKNIKPSDLQLSFWGGDAVLRNLELRLEVLERELNIPLEFKSGKIRELVLHIPWNAIASTPVVITIRDMEFVVRLKDVRAGLNTQSTDSTDSAASKDSMAESKLSTTDTNEQAPGYLQGYLSRISNNVIVHIQNLVVKVIEEECDMMLTLNIGAVEYYTTDEAWEKKFIYTDYLQDSYSINKVVEVTDMAINLHAIEEGGKSTVGSHDPFVQRCSFVMRLKSEYRGKIHLKKIVNILFESISFSVDEKQFCLYLHLMDWLLAMYYSSKHLKGRDDHLPSAHQATETRSSPQHHHHVESSPTRNDQSDTLDKGQSTESGISTDGSGMMESVPANSQGWGSWIMSFVGEAEGERDSTPQSSESTEMEKTVPCNSTFTIFSKSVTVTLKVTHQVQVPMFYSVQSFTSPVIQVSFTSCMAQLDKVPQTSLFLFSMGINTVEARIMGLCPCVKKLPSSWRRASASNITDRTEQVAVLSMGSPRMKDGSPDSLSETFLKRSLFDSQSDSNTIELPPLSESDLTKLGEPFNAVWFTYLYFDVRSSRLIEECTEQLYVGEMRASFSPDVVHRLQHFIVAFQKSAEANPKFSEGMVVIGDPKAETIFKIKLAGGFASLAPNTHYLAQRGGGGTPTKQLTPKLRKRNSQEKALTISSLRATCSVVDVHITQPMYRGNATADIPQKFHLRATLRDFQLGLIKTQSLNDCLHPPAELSANRGETTTYSSFNQFLSLPCLEVNQHSRTQDEHNQEEDTSYLQIDCEKVSTSLSLVHLSKLLFIGGSWKRDESSLTPPTSTDLSCYGHAHLSLTNITVTKSSNNQFYLMSIIVGELRGAIVTESDSRKLGHLVPVVYGPLNTDEWTFIEAYQQIRGSGSVIKTSTRSSGRLFELFVAIPSDHLKDRMFPTVQLSVAGCGLCLEPVLVDFIKHIPLGVMATGITNAPTSSVQPINKPLAPPTLSFPGPTSYHTVTPSQLTKPADETDRNKKDWSSLLKSYATKVDIKPLLIITPNGGQQSSSGSVVSPTKVHLNPDFPILSHLASSPSHTPSLVLSLPAVSILTARSVILDEPVPMEGSKDTFPWDCTLDRLSLFTVIRGRARYLLQPLTVKATLALQQEGTGMTVHTDSVVLAVSRKQLSLVNDVVTDLLEAVSSLSLSTCCSPDMEAEDSGIILSEPTHRLDTKQDHYPSSIVSSQSYSTVTPINAQTMSEISTTSSHMFQGFSTLWIQLLISKLSLVIYSRETCDHAADNSSQGNVSSSFTTPLTSPSTLNQSDSPADGGVKPAKMTVKLSLDVDGLSLQVDVQERCTDLIFKLTSMECSYLKTAPLTPDSWRPYLPSSNGKLFSSSSSLLPEDMRTPLMFGGPLNHVSSPQNSKLQPNFVHVTAKLPRDQPHKMADISVRVRPFELVAWLPLTQLVAGLLPETKYSSKRASSKNESSSTDSISSWPRLEMSIECFGIILPSGDYSRALMISSGGVQVSSSLEYVGSDVRFITNHGAFKKLATDKRMPPLPAYQLEAFFISLSGITRNDTAVSTLLYASTSEFKMVYTPPLYCSCHTVHPSSTVSSSVLATGHSLEANFTSDVMMFIGPDQVDCICNVVKTNRLTLTMKDTANDFSTMDTSPTRQSVATPSKLLLTGRSLTIFLLALNTVPEESIAIATPLLQAVVYNPLFSFQSTNEDSKMEVSCFNMAISYTDQLNTMAYSDLTDTQSSDIMSCQLLETKRGQPADKTSLPANLISVSWSHNQTDIESGSSAGVLSMDVGRPVKLSVSPFMLQELSKLLHHLSNMISTQLPGYDQPTAVEERDNSSVYLTPQKLLDEAKTKINISTELTLATSQLLIELQLASDPSSLDETDTPPSLASQETEVFLQGENVNTSFSHAAHSCKEGLLLAWDEFVLTVPAGTTTASCHTADLLVSGLQLVSLFGNEGSCFIVPPVQLSCLVSYHLPVSSYDRSNTVMKLSCGLVQFFTSQRSVGLLSRVAHSFSQVLQQLSQSTAEPPERHYGKESLYKTMFFTDDLRTGDFKYVVDESAVPQMPIAGDILFHNGGLETPPTMMWHYGEPRVVAKLHVLPVPFNVTSEEDAPVDIKIECSLEYWSDSEQAFNKLAHFHISEVSSAEWSLPLSVAMPTVASRVWRICLNHLEWVDEDMVEIVTLSKEDASSGSDVQISLSSILSPLSLAASTKIDSIFCPAFIPSVSLSWDCHELEVTLLHHTSNPPTSTSFNGYHIVSSSSDASPPQELFRLKATDTSCHFKHTESSTTAVRVGGSISLDYVDFHHLVWSTAVHPTKFLMDISYRHSTKVHSVDSPIKASQLPELSVELRCSPAVVRISQGLVHTATLAGSVWKTTHLDENDNDKVKGHPACYLLNNYILCNDTLEDLHIGQVSTDEDTLLPSNGCLGYSWRTHKTSSQNLQVCLVVDGAWRWSKPFSVDSTGVHSIQLPIAQQVATLYVKVEDIGGLQKQVIFFGSWKLFSCLHFPLEVQLCTPPSETSSEHSLTLVSSELPAVSTFHLKTFILPSQASLPSILAADSQLCGLRIRLSKEQPWSKVYPVGTSTQEWTKPQLLAEFDTGSGEMVHCWYSIKPMESTAANPWGNKITISPLFLLTNHLPFNLTMTVSDTQSLSALPGELHLPAANQGRPTADSHTLTPLLLPGNGGTVPLYSFNADMWYNIKLSCNEAAACSEPPLALSTYLLQHLPLPDKDDNHGSFKPATAFLSLPLDNDSSCCVHAALLRTSLNTVAVELRAETILINKCHSLSIQLVESITGEDERKWEGSVLVREKRERLTLLEPFDEAVMVQKQFVLRVEHHGRLFSSESVSLPVLLSSEESSKSKQNGDISLKSAVVQLKPQDTKSDSEDDDVWNAVMGQLILSFTRHDRALTVIVKPAFVIHNTTNHTLSTWPCVVNKADSALFSSTHPHSDKLAVAIQVPPGESTSIIYWQRIAHGASSSGQHNTICIRVSTNEDVVMTWTIYLSLSFVRCSFSLPVGCGFIPCLLTTHELDDITYLVVSHDPCPRVRIQNLCTTDFEVVGASAKSIHMYPQPVPAGHEVFYEPPALSKLYPMVYDEEIATDRDKKLFKDAQNVALKLRVRTSTNENTHDSSLSYFDRWSVSFPLSYDQDKVLAVPGVGDVLVSTDRQGHGLFISLLPTGGAAVHQLVDVNTVPSTEKWLNMRLNCHLTQLVVYLCNEVNTSSYISEVLRIIGDEAELYYSLSSQEGTKIDCNLQSLRIDNMTEKNTAEFAVTLLPRTEHAARPKLVKQDPPPLAKLLVHFNPHSKNFIDSLYVSLQPVTLQLEDNLLHKLRKLVQTFSLPGVLRTNTKDSEFDSSILVPPQVLREAELDVSPLVVTSLVIEPTAVYLKASVTLKAFLSCNDSPFRFPRYELDNIHSNWSEVSQVIAARYISTTFMHIGWLLGSLELIGSPGTFIQSIGRGLRDLVSLPYEGITRSPSLFIVGIGRGTASFFRECSTGALTSITNLASSISRNMERLSMDADHISYQDQKRKEQPAGLTTGVSSFGFSLMSAVAGIVEQPMQSVQNMDSSSATTLGATQSILTGVGKGLIGVVAKPVGGAMELVSQTGQGLMHGTGLASKLVHRSLDNDYISGFAGVVARSNLLTTLTGYRRDLGISECVAVVPASQTDSSGLMRSSLLVLTTVKMFVVDRETDSVQLTFPIKDYIITERAGDSDETELQLVACSSDQQSLANDRFESVERYLKLSEMEAQEMTAVPIEEVDEQEMSQGTLQVVRLQVNKHHATQLVCVYHNLRQFMSDPESCFDILHCTQQRQC